MALARTLLPWTPAIVTVALLPVVTFGVAMVASNMLADLVGLLYLLSTPGIYRLIDTRIAPTVQRTSSHHPGYS